MKLYDTGVYIADGTQIIADDHEAAAKLASLGKKADKAGAAQGTMAYGILKSHNTSGDMHELKIKFDKLTSHDITYVGIIQTSRAS